MLKYQTHLDEYSGEIIQTNDKPSVRDRLHNLKLYGKSIQDGEPTPDNPVPIQNVPSSFDVTSCGENLLDMSAHVSRTVNGVNITYNSADNTYILHGTVTAETYSFSNFINVPIKKGDFYGVKVNHLSGVVTQTGGNCVAFFGASDKPNATLNWSDTPLVNGSSYLSKICNYNYITRFWFYIDANAIGTTFDNYIIQIQLTEGKIDSDFKNYLGTTTTTALKDTDNNLHELCSLPDGTADEVDFDSGKIIKRVKKFVFSNDSYVLYFSENEERFAIYTRDTKNKWKETTGAAPRIAFCNYLKYGTSLQRGEFRVELRMGDTFIGMGFLKSDLTGNGFTLDDIGARQYLNKIIADSGQELVFYYPYSDNNTTEQTVFDLHPDEIAKLKQLKSVYPQTTIFTNTEVQPTISCGIRKLGNRPFIEAPIIDENGDYLVDENGNNIIGVI